MKKVHAEWLAREKEKFSKLIKNLTTPLIDDLRSWSEQKSYCKQSSCQVLEVQAFIIIGKPFNVYYFSLIF